MDRSYAEAALTAARRFGAEVVYERSEYLSRAGLRVSRALGIPLVLEVNGMLARDQKVQYRSFLEPVGARLERIKLRSSDAVVTVSPGLADRLISLGARSEAVTVVPNSVSTHRVGQAPVVGNGCVVGWVGHLMRWHIEALEFLIDAAAVIVQRVPAVRFEIVGAGPGEEALHELAREAGLGERFTFHGAVPFDEIPSFVRKFDVGVIPAVFDYAFPVKLPEMGAAGIPVVAPQSPSLDVLIEASVEYMPFRAGDKDAFADAVVCVLLDRELRSRLGAALQTAVRERFSTAAVASQLRLVIEGARRTYAEAS
jgi:glycosyltransferase involved in cell wall biosynthesis